METIPATRNVLSRHDVVIGMLIAAVMGTAFTLLSSGLSLIVTFVPGIVVTALTFAWLYVKQRPLPDGGQFIPVFIILLAVQFLHFAEEYLTGFHTRFPVLYGGTPVLARSVRGVQYGCVFCVHRDVLAGVLEKTLVPANACPVFHHLRGHR